MNAPTEHLMEVLCANAGLIRSMLSKHTQVGELEFVRARFYVGRITEASPGYVQRLEDIGAAL